MTTVASIRGRASPTFEGKRRIALSMYAKGKAFVGAYLLLQRQSSSEPLDYVALHNLCQGIEITLKGLLLLRDYDKYKPQLRRLGHHLDEIALAAIQAHALKPLKTPLSQELATLSKAYAQHLMRYGSVYDILVDPRTIERQRAVRRIAAVIRIIEREFKRGAVI